MREYVKKGFWSQSFKYSNESEDSSRYFLENSSYLVYTFNLSLNHDQIVIQNDRETIPENLVIEYGQFLSIFKNIELFKKVHKSYDISINIGRQLDSDSLTIPNILKDNETLSSFFSRCFNITVDSDKIINKYEQEGKLELGINQINNYKLDIRATDNYYAQAVKPLAEISESCFDYIKVKENSLDFSTVNDKLKKSSRLLLSFKEDFDTLAFRSWLLSTFDKNSLQSILTKLDTTSLDVSLLLYPPIITGMQLEDKPNIIEPKGIINKKIVSQVVFDVSRSFVETSRKVFEVYFRDNTTNDILHVGLSNISPSDFKIKYKGTEYNPPSIKMESSVFEDNDTTEFPSDSFRVVYILPTSVQKYLALNLNYNIEVRVTDLTSERI